MHYRRLTAMLLLSLMWQVAQAAENEDSQNRLGSGTVLRLTSQLPPLGQGNSRPQGFDQEMLIATRIWLLRPSNPLEKSLSRNLAGVAAGILCGPTSAAPSNGRLPALELESGDRHFAGAFLANRLPEGEARAYLQASSFTGSIGAVVTGNKLEGVGH